MADIFDDSDPQFELLAPGVATTYGPEERGEAISHYKRYINERFGTESTETVEQSDS